MSTIEVNLESLTDHQLDLFAAIDPEAVREERRRRMCFPSTAEGLTALAKARVLLEHRIEGSKRTRASRAVIDSGILDVVERLLLTARREGFNFRTPTLQEVLDGDSQS